MKLVLTRDDGSTEVFQDITDLYIAVRQETPRTDGRTAWYVPSMRSYSWGGNFRELIKEVNQSLIEMQDKLREMQNGGSS